MAGSSHTTIYTYLVILGIVLTMPLWVPFVLLTLILVPLISLSILAIGTALVLITSLCVKLTQLRDWKIQRPSKRTSTRSARCTRPGCKCNC